VMFIRYLIGPWFFYTNWPLVSGIECSIRRISIDSNVTEADEFQREWQILWVLHVYCASPIRNKSKKHKRKIENKDITKINSPRRKV
jgi:hypothetical protein